MSNRSCSAMQRGGPLKPVQDLREWRVYHARKSCGMAGHVSWPVMRHGPSCDMAVIITNHTSFDYKDIVKNAPLVFDTRNAAGEMKAKNLVRL